MNDKPHYHDEVNKIGLPPLADIEIDDPATDDFEALLVEAQERRTQSYRDVILLCAEAVRRGLVSMAADLLHQKKGWVHHRAEVFRAFGWEAIHPHFPIDLYAKSIKAGKRDASSAEHWLQMATDTAYRLDVLGYDDGSNIWSARHLADMAGIAKGATVSDVSQIAAGTEADVAEWEAGHIGLDIEGFEPSGERPGKVLFTGKLVEVLR